MATGRPQPSKAPARTTSATRPGARPSAAAPAKAAPVRITPHWAEFKQPTPGEGPRAVVDQPDDWKGDDVVEAGEFHPTPIWDSPGATVEGTYIGLSENRGPNAQRMYHFRHDDGSYFDVWGSTSMDQRLDQMLASGMLTTGYRMRVTFTGDVPTKRGQSPAHTFAILVKA